MPDRRILRLLFVAIVAMVLANVAPSRAQEPTESPRRLETFEFPSELIDTSSPGGRLSGGRTVPEVNVMLPKGYDSNPDADYPVLWLLHGANLGSDFSASSDLVTMAEDFPGIIVMPDGGVFGMYTDWWNGGERADPAWTTYHLTELMDHIESTYRIRPGREWHSLLGISMGGQGVLRYAALRPGYFGSVAAFSAAMPDIQGPLFQGGFNVILLAGGAPGGIDYPMIWGSPTGAYAEGNSPQALADNLADTRIFLSSGNGVPCPQDPITKVENLALDAVTEATINAQQLLTQVAFETAGIDLTAHVTCGVHTFGVWERAFADALRWGFFDRATPRVDEWTYRTIAGRGTMWGIDFDFDVAPSSVIRFDLRDGVLSAAGTGSVTLTRDGCSGEFSLPLRETLDESWPCRSEPLPAPTTTVRPSTSPPPTVAANGDALPATGGDSTLALTAAVGVLALWVALGWGRRPTPPERKRRPTR